MQIELEDAYTGATRAITLQTPEVDDQGRVLHEHPFQRLHRNAGGRPGRGIAGADLARVAKAGLQRRAGLAVDHRHLMAFLGEIIGGGDTEKPRAQNDDPHSATPCRLLVLSVSAWPQHCHKAALEHKVWESEEKTELLVF